MGLDRRERVVQSGSPKMSGRLLGQAWKCWIWARAMW